MIDLFQFVQIELQRKYYLSMLSMLPFFFGSFQNEINVLLIKKELLSRYAMIDLTDNKKFAIYLNVFTK